MKITNLSEIIGTLIKIENNNNIYNLIFSIRRKIELPKNVLSNEKLKLLLNKKIGILNCNGEYKIRELEKLKEESKT
jgi:hypothetical protein